MKIVNDKHLTLHQEAQDIINVAWFDGWDYCFIDDEHCGKYPQLSFIRTFVNSESIHLDVRTTPDYITQSVLTPKPQFSIKYNNPLLTIEKIQKVQSVLMEQQ